MPRERVLIVAKTRMGDEVCVGAVTSDGMSRRLLGGHGENQLETTFYNVGEVWDIQYNLPPQDKTTPPHVEDIYVTNQALEKSNVLMLPTLRKFITPWTGHVCTIYGGLLDFTEKGSAFIQRSTGIPDRSTWFWEVDQPLIYDDEYYYYQHDPDSFKVKYVGMEQPVPVLEACTLLRVSLARWRRFKHTDPERCYLQLSGWFL